MKKLTSEQRKAELLQGLKGTGSEVVYLYINQVAEILGIELAENLHREGTLVETQEAVSFKRHEGAMAVDKQMVNGLAEFNREELLEELEKHKFPEPAPAPEVKKQEPKKEVVAPSTFNKE